ncbi:MAG: DUF2303 family protein [Dermatophilaceae bacterium]|nr:DUF2303 family protein [Dermatophilaceae bacterium]
MSTDLPAISSGTINGADVDAIAELVRKGATVDPTFATPGAPLLIGRNDEHFLVQSLEGHLNYPLRARGSATITDPSDFVEYVNRLLNVLYTTVWADEENGRITAVLDDHANGGAPGWRSHNVILQLTGDADWAAWTGHNGKSMTQVAFAEFLQDVAHTIVEPSAADLMMVATTLSAKRKVDFSSSVRTDNGDVQFTYDEQTTASAGRKGGTLDIPEQFRIKVTPWLGVDPIEMTALLRYRINEDKKLTLAFRLIRPDIVKRQAFAGVIGTVRAGLHKEGLEVQLPVLNGTAPAALSAAR